MPPGGIVPRCIEIACAPTVSADNPRSSITPCFPSPASPLLTTLHSLMPAILERVGNPAQPALPHANDVEADVEAVELGPSREPRLRRAAHAALLLGADHLRRIAERGAALLLHLDEAQRPAASRDEVDLAAGRPHVRAEDAPAAQPVPACSTP